MTHEGPLTRRLNTLERALVADADRWTRWKVLGEKCPWPPPHWSTRKIIDVPPTPRPWDVT